GAGLGCPSSAARCFFVGRTAVGLRPADSRGGCSYVNLGSRKIRTGISPALIFFGRQSRGGLGLLLTPRRPSCRLERVIDEVRYQARPDQDHSKGERAHIPNLL